MTLKTQIFVILIVLFAIGSLINMIRKHKVDLQYSLLWFLLAFAILILAIFPSLLDGLTNALGIGLPINLLFFAGFCFSLVIIFSLSLSLSKLSEKHKQLTQEVGLLKEKLEKIESKQ